MKIIKTKLNENFRKKEQDVVSLTKNPKKVAEILNSYLSKIFFSSDDPEVLVWVGNRRHAVRLEAELKRYEEKKRIYKVKAIEIELQLSHINSKCPCF